MTTFTFESRYRDGGGGRCDVIVAPDRDTAIRAAAMGIIVDNDWEGSVHTDYPSLSDFFEGEMEILSEWEDLNGTACPNCTSHNGKETGDHFDLNGATREVLQCEACGYQWVPLGLAPEAAVGMSHDLKAELDAFERENMSKESCRTEGCDEDPDDGDGWDGFCGNCADRREGEDDEEV